MLVRWTKSHEMLDQGYPSGGDWHSTSEVGEGQIEGAGAWTGKEKTEWWLHINFFCDEGTGEARQMSSKFQTVQIYIPVPAWTLLFFISPDMMWTGLFSWNFHHTQQGESPYTQLSTFPVPYSYTKHIHFHECEASIDIITSKGSLPLPVRLST